MNHRPPLTQHREDNLCLTLDDVAKRAKVTIQTVHYWETKAAVPHAKSRRAAAAAYDLEWPKFLDMLRKQKKRMRRIEKAKI